MALVMMVVGLLGTRGSEFSLGVAERRLEQLVQEKFNFHAVDVQGLLLRADFGQKEVTLKADKLLIQHVATAPPTVLNRLGARFSMPELLHGSLNPRGLALGGVELEFILDEDGRNISGQTGSTQMGLASSDNDSNEIPSLTALGLSPIAQDWSTPQKLTWESLSQLSWLGDLLRAVPSVSTLVLDDVNLRYIDHQQGLGFWTESTRLQIDRLDQLEIAVDVSGTVSIGQNQHANPDNQLNVDDWRWQDITASVKAVLGQDLVLESASVSASGLIPAQIPRLVPDNPYWSTANDPLSITANVSFDDTGRPATFNSSVVGLTTQDLLVSGQSLAETGGWKLDLLMSNLVPAEDLYLAQHFDIFTAIEAKFSGVTTLLLDNSGELVGYEINASQVDAGTLSFPDIWTKPQSIRGSDISVWGDQSKWQLITNGLQVSTLSGWADVQFSAEGQTTADQDQAQFGFVIPGAVDTQSVIGLWPDAVADDPVRAWSNENVASGMLSDGQISFQLSGAPGEQLTIMQDLQASFGFNDALVKVTDAMGYTNIASGDVKIEDTTVLVQAGQGTLGPITGQNLSMLFDFSDSDLGMLTMQVNLESEIAPALVWMSTAGISAESLTTALPVSQISGRSSGTLSATIPLTEQKDAFDALVRYEYDASLTNFALSEYISGQTIAGAVARISVDNQGVAINGGVNFGSALLGYETVADVDLGYEFASDLLMVRGQFSSTIPAFAPFLGGLSEFASGALQGQYNYRAQPSAARARLDVVADLQNVQIDLPAGFYTKPIGRVANGSLSVEFENDRLARVSNFRFSSIESEATGRAEFSVVNNERTRIWFDTLDLEGSSLSDVVLDIAGKQIEVFAPGGQVNLVAVVETLFAGQPIDQANGSVRQKGFGLDPETVIVIRAENLSQVLLPNGRWFSNVTASLSLQNDGIEHMRFRGQPPPLHRGRAPDAGYLTASIEPVQGGYNFALTADDAGSAFYAIGLLDSVRLGTVRIEAYSPLAFPHGAWRGSLNAENLILQNAPILGRLFQVASLTGIGELLSGTGLSFSRVNSDFNYSPGSIYVDSWQMLGPSIGMTGQGGIDFDSKFLNLRGTVTPLGALNEITQQLPVLGTFLNGLDGGGLFSATYVIEGRFEDPSMFVNPWTSLTPGAFRDFYRAVTGSF